MKRVLLPTDFSDNSINAMHYALQLLQSEPCTFYVLNVQKVASFVSDDLMAMQPSATVFDSLIEAAKIKIKRLIEDLKSAYENPLHSFEAKVDYDNFIDAINQQIAIEQIDLIVMGTKGASNVAKVVFGSNAARVIQRGTCPVLAVPNDYKFNKLKQVAFTSNYYSTYKLEELQTLIDLATRYDATVNFLHVKESDHLTEHQENNRALLDKYFSGLIHSFTELEEGDLFKVITQYIVANEIDILAMMSRKHSFLERIFVRHAAESFAFDLKVPLLVMENTSPVEIK